MQNAVRELDTFVADQRVLCVRYTSYLREPNVTVRNARFNTYTHVCVCVCLHVCWCVGEKESLKRYGRMHTHTYMQTHTDNPNVTAWAVSPISSRSCTPTKTSFLTLGFIPVYVCFVCLCVFMYVLCVYMRLCVYMNDVAVCMCVYSNDAAVFMCVYICG